MVIYKIINQINGKLYIGQTSKTIEERFIVHVCKARQKVNRYLYDAMNKYGYDNFKIELIEENVIDADEREKYWIKKLNTMMPNGYNMTIGGGGGYTLETWSEENKQKLYIQQAEKRKRPRSNEFKEKMKIIAKEREAKKTKEQKELISKKISFSAKQKGLHPPITRLYGKDNPNFIDIKKEDLIRLVRNGYTKKQIAELYNTTGTTIWNKIKILFGEDYDFFRLKREFN